MTLPTFLGIGVPRAGSTWITYHLSAHPDIYMAPGKELFFFNRYYDRGLKWYEKRFADANVQKHKAIGEFTPEYLYCAQCPTRIAALPSISKLIISLRNPIQRAYSHYGLWVRSMNYKGSFEDALATTQFIDMGFYGRYLEKYFEYFDRDQILVLIFEKTIAKNPDQTKELLAEFLDLDTNKFPGIIQEKGRNRSYVPKLPYAYSLYARAMQLFLKLGFHTWVKRIRNYQIEHLFGEAGPIPPLKKETTRSLWYQYQEDVNKLEKLLKADLSHWKFDKL